MTSFKGFAHFNEHLGRLRTGLMLLALVLLATVPAFARDYSPDTNYLATTDGERGTEEKDLIIPPPPPDNSPNLNTVIFNDKLTKEFKDRYDQIFGYTEEEQVLNSPNRYTYYNDIYGFQGTQTAYDQARSDYGNYILRRLAEYHVDNFAKSDPSVRPLWEAKEKLSQVKVEIQKVRLDFQYEIAGNTFDIKVVQPWLDTCTVRLQFNPGTIGPGPVDETIVSLAKKITPTVSAESHYKVTEGIVDLITRKALTERLSTSWTMSTFTNDSTASPRESRYLAGIGYRF